MRAKLACGPTEANIARSGKGPGHQAGGTQAERFVNFIIREVLIAAPNL